MGGPLYSEWSGVTSDKVTLEQRLKGDVAEEQGWGGGIFWAEGVRPARGGTVPPGTGRLCGRSSGGRAEGTAITSEREWDLQAVTGYIKDFAFHSE